MKNESVGIQDINVIDLILIDHRYIKECVEVMIDEKADKRQKMSLAKGFLEAVHIHSQTEKKAIYAPLVSNEELHFNILEAEIEHGIIDQKIRSIKAKMARARVLRDEHEAELKVLAELIKKHIIEEESEILPKIMEAVDDATLTELGIHYMKLRKFSPRDLQDYPQLQDELIEWKDSIQKVSSEFLTKMDKFVENLQH
ncbi:hemerythrin domain-containing protein [Peredibacter starrii]|uniref:Hemerythrin domain-containing protein n=1 Tax=Peredibacter starrii TaxID=28202 RepID=A0AAX4HLN2_9BACT|nr:hemerythrin domain-containing protein [Peredibacter starrii]WPU64169.1 hemerythrin domain-containing protein [Peredibacter starrii]